MGRIKMGGTDRRTSLLNEKNPQKAPVGNIVPLSRSGERTPFFAVHGEGHIFFYLRLAKRLADARPFYAIKAYGLNGGSLPYETLVDYATDYVRQVRICQPAGPYYIGGYCQGAFIAFEMVRQLSEAGEEAPLVILLDTGPADVSRPRDDSPYLTDDVRANLSRVRAHYQMMVDQHRPGDYEGRAVLIQPASLAEDIANRPTLKLLIDRCSGGCESYRIGNGSGTMFEEPGVEEVARVINAQLCYSR